MRNDSIGPELGARTVAGNYDQLVAQAREMRNEFIAAATREADQWLAATLAMIGRLPCVSQEPDSEGGTPVPFGESRPQSLGNGTLSSHVKQAIDEVKTKTFTSVDIRNSVARSYGSMGPTQRANVATLLKRMVQRGELDLVAKGEGSRPARYRKVEGQIGTLVE